MLPTGASPMRRSSSGHRKFLVQHSGLGAVRRRIAEDRGYQRLALLMLGLLLLAVGAWRSGRASGGGGDEGWLPHYDGAWSGGKPSKIPKLIHHMYLGEGFPERHRTWIEGCKFLHERAGWKYKMWGMKDVEELIKKHRPDYLDTFWGYEHLVNRIDIGKYFIMYYVGGLYLDTDVECFREGYDFLEGYDLVVQACYPGAAANSGVLAAAPNHPVWEKAVEVMAERRYGKRQDTGYTTGPQIVRDMIIGYHDYKLGPNGEFPRLLKTDGRTTIVYPMGEWLTPCGFSSGDCHKDFLLTRAAGDTNLTRLAGYHRFTALWLGFKDGQHPQQKDTILKAFCGDGKDQKQGVGRG